MPISTLLSQPRGSAKSSHDFSSDHTEYRGRRSVLLGGFHLLLANKRLLLWTWCASLLCGILPTLSFARHIGSYLNHSLAAQEIAGRVDLGYIAELLQQAGKHGGITPTSSFLSIALFTVLSFIFAAGALYVFQSGASPRLSIVAKAGLDFFWRFVRLTFIAVVVIGLTLWLLTTLRDGWLMQADKTYVGKAIFLRSSITLAAISCVALLLRFYFDLAEAIVVQLGIAGDRRVRRSLPAAVHLLRGNFLRSFLSYFLIGSLGVALFALCLYVWVAAVSPYSNVMAFILGQLGIVCLIASRLWQRAALASLVMQNTALIIPADIEVLAAKTAVPMLAENDARSIW
jgi:hypothetical protein